MESTIIDAALSQGIWAVVAIFLLIYIVKGNEKRDAKQEEREENYQMIIDHLTEQFADLNNIKDNVMEIKDYIFSRKSTDITESGTLKSKRNNEM